MNFARCILVFLAVLVGVTSASGQIFDGFFISSQVGLSPIATPEDDDQFGTSLATGDFNGDGIDDLVIGVPFEDIGSATNAGAFFVRYGGDIWTWEVWTQDFVGANTQAFALFGAAFAVADLNRDGYDDLVVGAPFRDLGGSNEGEIFFFYGSQDDLRFHSSISNPEGIVNDQHFGAALTAVDSYLFVGAPGLSGSVVLMAHEPPGNAGLCGTNSYDQSTAGIPGAAEIGDEFGAALAVANFDPATETVDLVVGAPGEAIGAEDEAGAAWTLSLDLNNAVCGTIQGASLESAELHHQGMPPIFGSAEAGERFGSTIVVGNFNGVGADEIVIGVPFEDVDGLSDVGCIHIINPTFISYPCWPPYSWSPEIEIDNTQQFGSALAAGDLNDDGLDDLVIGMPGQFGGSSGQAGAIIVQLGSPGSLIDGPDAQQRFTEAETGSFYRFGTSLAIGDFLGTGVSDLAIGEPGADSEGVDRDGRVTMLFTVKPLFTDGFETGTLDAWSASAP